MDPSPNAWAVPTEQAATWQEVQPQTVVFNNPSIPVQPTPAPSAHQQYEAIISRLAHKLETLEASIEAAQATHSKSKSVKVTKSVSKQTTTASKSKRTTIQATAVTPKKTGVTSSSNS